MLLNLDVGMWMLRDDRFYMLFPMLLNVKEKYFWATWHLSRGCHFGALLTQVRMDTLLANNSEILLANNSEILLANNNEILLANNTH